MIALGSLRTAKQSRLSAGSSFTRRLCAIGPSGNKLVLLLTASLWVYGTSTCAEASGYDGSGKDERMESSDAHLLAERGLFFGRERWTRRSDGGGRWRVGRPCHAADHPGRHPSNTRACRNGWHRHEPGSRRTSRDSRATYARGTGTRCAYAWSACTWSACTWRAGTRSACTRSARARRACTWSARTRGTCTWSARTRRRHPDGDRWRAHSARGRG